MKLQDLINSDDPKVITAELRSKRHIDEPDVESTLKALDPLQHEVFDKALRPDKMVRVDSATNDDERRVMKSKDDAPRMKPEPVARIGLDLPNVIVKRAASMIFGNPVEVLANPEGDAEEMVLMALNAIRHDIKERSLNRRIARHMFSCTEVAEVWYPVPIDRKRPNVVSHKFGIDTKFKLRCLMLSPLLGDKLYPYFDETGDMVAFSREYERTDEKGATRQFFETWTDEEHILFVQDGGSMAMAEGFPKENVIGKIPVVFGHEEEPEFAKVMILINRLEKLLSNFADTNDYHAAPKIFIQGEIKGFAKKGESGAIIEGTEGSSAQYLSWANAPESVKLEIETLLRMIYTLTQTPDISFDSVKGLNLSGVALKLLFMDAHLKVMDHMEVFDEYLQRRFNIVKAFIGKFDTKLESAADSLDVEPEVTPFMITDDATEINTLLNATGGKPIMSQKTAIRKAGIVSDVDAEVEQITAETDRSNAFFLQEPTNAE